MFASVLSLCGRKLEYLEETHLSELVKLLFDYSTYANPKINSIISDLSNFKQLVMSSNKIQIE